MQKNQKIFTESNDLAGIRMLEYVKNYSFRFDSMDNSKTWILIADASKARIYSIYKAILFKQQDPKNLHLIGEYAHTESRKKDRELTQDRLGEFGSGTFVEATSPKLHEAEQFAQELLTYLETGRKEGSFRDLILVAPPTFMGLINKHMPHEMGKLVSKTIEKNYTQHTQRELIQNLLQHI